MTVLIISTPPMAAMFFQGTVGNFMTYSQFGQGGAARAAAVQQGMPGTSGETGNGRPSYTGGQAESSKQPNQGFATNPGATTRLNGAPPSAHADVIRPAPSSPGVGE